MKYKPEECQTCSGSGMVLIRVAVYSHKHERCPVCDGSGRAERVEVQVPVRWKGRKAA